MPLAYGFHLSLHRRRKAPFEEGRNPVAVTLPTHQAGGERVETHQAQDQKQDLRTGLQETQERIHRRTGRQVRIYLHHVPPLPFAPLLFFIPPLPFFFFSVSKWRPLMIKLVVITKRKDEQLCNKAEKSNNSNDNGTIIYPSCFRIILSPYVADIMSNG